MRERTKRESRNMKKAFHERERKRAAAARERRTQTHHTPTHSNGFVAIIRPPLALTVTHKHSHVLRIYPHLPYIRQGYSKQKGGGRRKRSSGILIFQSSDCCWFLKETRAGSSKLKERIEGGTTRGGLLISFHFSR